MFAQNLITNPGFELPGFSLNPNYRFLNDGNSTLLTGWTFSYDGVNEPSFVFHRSRYQVFSGDYSVALNDGDGCSTWVQTDQGCSYVVSLTFAGDDGGDVRFRAGDLDVSMNPNIAAFGTGVVRVPEGEWKRIYFPFTALAPDTAVIFNDMGQGLPFQGRIIDDVSVVRGVAIARQPASASSCPSGTTSIAVIAVGVGPVAFQWQYESIPNTWTDAAIGPIPYTGGTIIASNVTTDQLQLALNTTHGAPPIRFRCIVTNSCGNAISDPATLQPCQADFTCDGLVEDADFVVFAAAYNILDCADLAMPADCPADLNNDGLVDDSDFVLFVQAYNALGCV